MIMMNLNGGEDICICMNMCIMFSYMFSMSTLYKKGGNLNYLWNYRYFEIVIFNMNVISDIIKAVIVG